MLFDEGASVDGLDELLEAALNNCADVDVIEYMNLEEIYDATQYFDVNRKFALKDKLVTQRQ